MTLARSPFFSVLDTVSSAPTELMAVAVDRTSIRVTWTPPTPLGDTTGYIIFYTNRDSSDSSNVTADGGSTDEYTLTGLQNGATYTISIIATSQHFFSDPVSVQFTLSKRALHSYV